MLIFKPMFAPEGAAGEAGAGVAAEPAESQSAEVAAPEAAEPHADPNFEKDRDDVRQMSSFLRDFQQRQAESQTEEPEQEPDTPPVVEPKPTKAKAEPAPGTVPAQEAEAPQVYKLPDGRELTAEQIIEFEKGHMMQADYSRKTQALAEQRRALEAEKEKAAKAFKLMQDYERDPVGTAQRLQEEAEAKGFYEPLDPETLKLEDKKRELEAKELEIEQKEQEYQQQQVYRDLESRVIKLEEKNGPEFDRQKVIQFMIDEKISSPEVAWNAIRADQLEVNSQKQIDGLKAQIKKAKEEAVNEYIKAKTTKRGAPLPVGAGSNTGSPPVQVNKPKTFDDAKKAAMARNFS